MDLHAKIKSYFCSDRTTELSQLVCAFVIGILFGPFSTSLIWRLIYVIVYLIVIFYFTRGEKPYWKTLTRIAIISISFYGYLLGRWLVLGTTGLENYFTFRHVA